MPEGADGRLLIYVSDLSGGRQAVLEPIVGVHALRARAVMRALVLAARAASPQGGGAPRDHDAVRRAVEAGEIRPLRKSNAIRGKLPGEIAGVEIERKNGRWLYEFRVVDRQGRLFEVYVDARSGEIERIKEK